MNTVFLQYAFWFAVGFYLLGLGFHLLHRPIAGQIILSIGFIFHSLFLLSRTLLLGFWYPPPLFEETFFLPWILALIGLGLNFFSNHKDSHKSWVIPLCFFSVIALFFPKGIIPPNPKMLTIYSSFFFLSENLAHACFILGAWFAFFYLKNPDGNRIFSAFIIWGFIFYSIAQIVGAYWSYLGWATPIHWGPRHLQSASLWVFYTAALHWRYLGSGTLKQEAGLALIGFLLLIIFSYGGWVGSLNYPRITGGMG